LIAEAKVYGVNKRADVPPVHFVGSKGYDADRRPDPTPNDMKMPRGVRKAHTPIEFAVDPKKYADATFIVGASCTMIKLMCCIVARQSRFEADLGLLSLRSGKPFLARSCVHAVDWNDIPQS
jgi:hypothetical protein